ncbi:AAA family ATPase [Sphaerisporangium sp. NBC_01403]|uniref:MinD/ParA family ATP-binding protein n=1 Tax=Sphaerisporangium sp. NBC_01403 TaxID=2903599 RepID=UPI00386F09CC
MARHDREDPHSLEEQLAWLDAIKENEEAPVPVTVTADDTVVSPYPKDPWAMVPAEPPAASSPLFRAAGDPTHGTTQPDDTAAERGKGDTTELRTPAAEGLGGWGKKDEAPSSPGGGRDTGAFSAPITGPSEPLSRSDTSSPSGGAFGERSPSSGAAAFGERSPSSGSGAFGERSPSSGSGAFGERAPSSGGGAFGAFGDRPASSGGGAFGERGAGAFGERPAQSGGGFGESTSPPPASSASSTASSAASRTEEQSVSDDTDSFTFGSLTEEPPGGTGSGWVPVGPLASGKGDTPKPYQPEPKLYEPEPKPYEPEPEATGEQSMRGWLEAALPAAETGEADPEQERFNAFVSAGGANTDDVVVPRVEHALYEPEKAPPAKRPPAPATGGEPKAQAANVPAAEPATQEQPPEEQREPYRARRRQSPPPAHPLQPAWGTSTRQQGAAKAASGVRQTADSLDPVSLLRGRRNAPAGGWRKLVFKASAGLIKPGESPEVRRRRELVARARTPVATGHHRVAVLSLKGGVGKTTTTVGLGATLASVRGDRVIAVDANPDRGTLSDKVELETSATVRDLLNERQQIKRYVDIRAFTSQAPSRLEILASDRDPSVSEAFSAADYQSVAQVLENFYSICLTDCGTGLLHSAMSGVLGLADQLVLVSSPSVDGARAASATLDWLEAHHYADLVKAATVVLCSVRPRSKSTVDLDRLEAHFAARCRAVIRVPYDPHLEEGAEIDLDRLQPATREAYLLLAASVGDNFGGARG